jgi:hypothetical protein
MRQTCICKAAKYIMQWREPEQEEKAGPQLTGWGGSGAMICVQRKRREVPTDA